jgi:hypothetical protein
MHTGFYTGYQSLRVKVIRFSAKQCIVATQLIIFGDKGQWKLKLVDMSKDDYAKKLMATDNKRWMYTGKDRSQYFFWCDIR